MKALTDIFHVAGKDLRALFVSPIAYVVLTGYVVLSGWFFFNLLMQFISKVFSCHWANITIFFGRISCFYL